MIKSSWNKFIVEAKQGVIYLGSVFDQELEAIENKINNFDTSSHKIDRTLVKGVSVLQFARPDTEELSYLDKKGTVYSKDNFFIIKDKNVTIVYAIPNNRIKD